MTTTTYPISPYADTLYSLDIIHRIKELQTIDSDERTSNEERELTALMLLEEACGDSPLWNYGAELVRESYFPVYTRRLVSLHHGDFGRWFDDCIDWGAVMRKLKQHKYKLVEFMGQAFWIQV